MSEKETTQEQDDPAQDDTEGHGKRIPPRRPPTTPEGVEQPQDEADERPGKEPGRPRVRY